MEEKSKAVQALQPTPIQGGSVLQRRSKNMEQEAKAVQVPEPTPMIKFHGSVVNAVDEIVMNGADPTHVKEVMLKAFEMGETWGLIHRRLNAEEASIMDGFTEYMEDVVYRLSDLNLIPQYIVDIVKGAVEKVLAENLPEEGSEEWA